MFGEVAAPGQATEILRAELPYMDRPITFGLLTGGATRKRKQEILNMTASGEIDVLIGTHALIQKEVAFAGLGLVIVDEQHRFGVMQRAELRQKGYNPHLLVMTRDAHPPQSLPHRLRRPRRFNDRRDAPRTPAHQDGVGRDGTPRHRLCLRAPRD